MTVLRTESFEGGAAGTAVTATNSSFASLSGNGLTYDATVIKSGQSAVTNGVGYGVWNSFGTLSAAYFRMWFQVVKMPTTAKIYLAEGRIGSAFYGICEVGTDAHLAVRNVQTKVTTGTTTMALLTSYRFEWDLTQTTQTARLYDAAGNLLEPALTGAAPATGGIDAFWVGPSASTDGIIRVDELSFADAPLAPISTVTRNWKVNRGGVAVPLNMNVNRP